MSKEGWIKRIRIDGDRVEENGEVLDPEKTKQVKKMWREQQHIDLSVWGKLSDEDLLKFIEKGRL